MGTSIFYVTGDATAPGGTGNQVIVHVCNDIGGWGKGFVVAISKRWPEPEAQYRQWYKERELNDFALGSVQLVQVEPHLWVANLIGQHNNRPSKGSPPIRYDAIREGLSVVSEFATANQASVHMPRIGCGLAGGKWEEIEPLLDGELIQRGVSVVVYDFG